MTTGNNPRSEYYAQYYKDNKKRIAEKRHEKYKNDPKYRKKVLDRNRNSRQSQIQDRKISEAHDDALWGGTYREYEVDGVTFATIGAVAAALNCSEETIREWEERKIIPPCEYRSEKGNRLYTKESLMSMYRALHEHGKLKWVKSESGHEVPQLRYRQRPSSARIAVISSNGVEQELLLYRVGALALSLGYAVSTIVSWEKEGRLPPTPFRSLDKNGKPYVRMYTLSMIEACVTILRQAEKDPLSVEAIRAKIEAAWTQLGYYGPGVSVVSFISKKDQSDAEEEQQ